MSSAPSTVEKGRVAEEEAVRLLVARGYRVVARNARTRGGEIDVVAWDGRVLCFVEVRSRADARHGSALHTIGWRKQARLARAAGAWLAAHVAGPPPPCRFDVVARTGRDLRVVQGAFDAPA